MADEAGAAKPSAPAADPFAGAKANLRDTVKWLTTTLAAVAGAVVAGTSLTGISGLTGWRLAVALAGGAIGLICIFVATGTALRLLTSESFFLGELESDTEIKQRLDKHAADILPPEFQDLDEFLRLRKAAMAEIATTKGNPENPDYRNASVFFTSLEPTVGRLVNLAHFEVLRRNLKRNERPLFLLSMGAIIGLGVFAVLTGAAKKTDGADPGTITVQLSPGKGWADLAKAYAVACGDEPTVQARIVHEPKLGWVQLRIAAPEKCAGVLVTIPARLIAMPGQVGGAPP